MTTKTVEEFTITKPDDFHLHLRSGSQMKSVVGFSAQQFGRAIIMPNLKNPITTVRQVFLYHQEVLDACNEQGLPFTPLMTLYLTDNTSEKEILTAKASGIVYGCKLYPAGATTNSNNGVTSIEKMYPLFEVMEKVGMPLLIHGEVTDPNVDIFDREKVFIDRHLSALVRRFSDLRIVLEHVTTWNGVQFVESCHKNVGATVTAHHLLSNRNDLLIGGIKPHNYCLPILKKEEHRRSLVIAATSGSSHFFLGTDSAPHPQSNKESACGCAGCFTTPHALALYAEAFEKSGHSDWMKRLETFASFNGADFYGLPRNTSTITLVKEEFLIPDLYPFGEKPPCTFERGCEIVKENNYLVIPFRAGETLRWKVKA